MTEMDIIELSLYIGFISLCMIVYFSPSIINYLKKSIMKNFLSKIKKRIKKKLKESLKNMNLHSS